MSDLTTAQEQVAPAPATTNFFPRESTTSRLAGSRGTLESAKELHQTVSRLEQDRWDRTSRARQQEMWGRDDEDYNAKKDFEAKRGRFLSEIGRIDASADDYEDRKNEFISTLPEEAMQDDAVRAMFANMDRVAGEQRMEKRRVDDEGRYRTRYEEQAMRDAVKRASLAGVDQGRMDEYIAAGRWQDLLLETGRIERGREMDKAAGKAAEPPSRADLDAETKLLNRDRAAFPRKVDTEYEKWRTKETPTMFGGPKQHNLDKTLEDYRETTDYDDSMEEEMDYLDRFIEAGGHRTREGYMKADPRVTSEDAREVRGRVWDAAQARLGHGTPAAPAPAAPAPAAPAPAAPQGGDLKQRFASVTAIFEERDSKVAPHEKRMVDAEAAWKSAQDEVGRYLEEFQGEDDGVLKGARLKTWEKLLTKRDELRNKMVKVRNAEGPKIDAIRAEYEGYYREWEKDAAPAPAAPAPAAPAGLTPADQEKIQNAPKKELSNGQTAYWVDGQWMIP